MAVGRCFRIFHKYVEGSAYSIIMDNTRRPDEFLLLESNVVAVLRKRHQQLLSYIYNSVLFLFPESNDCDEFKKQYKKLLDAYGCMGILQLRGAGETSISYLCMVTACVSVGKIGDCDVYRVTGTQFYPMHKPLHPGQNIQDDRIYEIQKLISGGTFYFAWSPKAEGMLDLSLSAQKRFSGHSSDHRFFWNRSLHLAFYRYGIDTSAWLLRCMCGAVEIKTVYVGQRTAKACLISRLSCERMGTRFNVRGVNDDGHVANFVETEQVIFYDDETVSLVQTRGSVPLFWEQPGVQVGSHKVKMSRGFEASAPAYDRHLKTLKHYYGKQLLVNLLGTKEGEKSLTLAFQTHHENSCHSKDTTLLDFDYHALIRASNKPHNIGLLWDKLRNVLVGYSFFHSKDGDIVKSQTGTVRTNCLDCLDRTNCVQSFIGLQVLIPQLAALGLLDKQNFRSRFEEVFKSLWQANGDHCSKIYAGTGALDGKSKLKDASRSVTRTIQNNLMDGSKQEAMDLFLLGTGLNSHLYDRACSLLPVTLLQGCTTLTACPNVLKSVVERSNEFTTEQKVRVFCGTWNVNGGMRFKSVAFRDSNSISDWILDLPLKSNSQLDSHSSSEMDLINDYSTPYDIFAIGLEEIVDLNASNIMSASTTNQRIWAEELLKVLCRDYKYIMITSQQLVGVCMFIFIRPHLAPFIRELSTDQVKTGLGGAAGNKGGVAVRFCLYSTSLCFVCSHFAAGQSNVSERNNDFQETCKRTVFPMGRGIYSHDLVFWMGDFNYRIDLGGEETFTGFREGHIDFPPTYKYDTFSDDYDTSEKCRTPAWTDRVLWWVRPPIGPPNENCKLMFYGRAELKTSDHRPVGAIFEVDCRQVDTYLREKVYQEVVSCMGPSDATVLVSVEGAVSGQGFPSDKVDQVLAKVNELGMQVLLVKFVSDDMWLIFQDGEMALGALSMHKVKLSGGSELSVKLRSENWQEESRLELEEARWIGAGTDQNYSLLEDNNKHNIMFEEQEEDEFVNEGVVRVVSCASLQSAPTSLPPARPSQPPKRPPPPKSIASAPNMQASNGEQVFGNTLNIGGNDVTVVSPGDPDWQNFVGGRADGNSTFYGSKTATPIDDDPWGDKGKSVTSKFYVPATEVPDDPWGDNIVKTEIKFDDVFTEPVWDETFDPSNIPVVPPRPSEGTPTTFPHPVGPPPTGPPPGLPPALPHSRPPPGPPPPLPARRAPPVPPN